MYDILKHPKLKLIYSKHKRLLNESSQSGGWNLSMWNITGDWHIMTIDTNADKSSGLDGSLALNAAGSWTGGVMSRDINLKTYGEIAFEHYVQNDGYTEGSSDLNHIIFRIDGVKKSEIKGPSPWQRCEPIGLRPGRHIISFEYILNGGAYGKKGVIDTVTVSEGRDVKCLVTEHTPPKPSKRLGSNAVLRGYTRFQEMTKADTEIGFTAVFDGLNFMEFMQKSDEPFYFVDEFGVCYRGIFPQKISPKSIAMNEVYSVELTMVAGQKAAVVFC